ncbi:MAG: helix-hairpin-helix domain-containing protein [bacterium]
MIPKPFKRWIQQYLHFSKKDRNAVVILSVLILVVMSGHVIINHIHLSSGLNHTKIRQTLAEWNNMKEQGAKKYYLFSFDPNNISSHRLDSLQIPDFVKRNIISYREAGGRFKKPGDLQKIYGMNDSIFSSIEKYISIPSDSAIHHIEKHAVSRQKPVAKKLSGYFDPNKADLDTLLLYGFNRFQASNLIKYREKGGTFYQPHDLLRIYGVDSSFYLSIVEYIQIHSLQERDSRKKEKSVQYIELNSADSAELVQLYGIGPVFASRIIQFRELLGGYNNKDQLLEIYNLPEDTYRNIEEKIITDTTAVKKIRINFAGYGDLLRHPYLEKKHVEAIVDFRETNGVYHSVSQLNTEGIVDSETYKRIKPYLSCR